MALLNKTIEYGILLFVFLVPWQARLILSEGSINGAYWEYGTRSLYLTEVLLFFILLALIAKGAVYIIKTKPRFNVRCLYSPSGAILFLILWAGASILWSYDRSIALERWSVLAEAGAVFLILSSGIVPFRKICWAIILSALVQSFFGITQFLLQEVMGSAWLGMSSQHGWISGASVVETDLRRWLRAYGTFPHPNILGGYLALSLSFVCDHLLINKFQVSSFKFQKIFLLPIFAVILFALLATFSRGAWIAFILSFILYFLFFIIKRKEYFIPAKILLVSIAVVSVFSIVFWEPMSARIGLQGRLEAKSNTERVLSLQDGWKIIKTHPMFGVGIGNYGLAVRNEIEPSQEAWFYQPVHNVPMLIWAELGIIGVLLIVLSVFLSLRGVSSTLRATRQSYRRNEQGYIESHTHRNGKIAAVASTLLRNDTIVFLFPLLVISLFDHYLWSLYPGMMISAVYLSIFWLILGKNDDFRKAGA